MAKYEVFLFFYTFFILFFTVSLFCKATDEDRKVYIVYMGSLPDGLYSPLSDHHSILQGVVKDGSIANSLIRSYRRSFNGFAAKLNDHERQTIANMKEVVSVFPSLIYRPQTTRSWDFIGFQEDIDRNPTAESDVIIGVIDTGIWPESDSFKDEGFGPAPKKWRGVCKGGTNFTCNNKIIGARYYSALPPNDQNARDIEGHGTHTTSTAAGNKVKDASFNELAAGTARGGVPSSRIAAYKVCNPVSGCATIDILAAFDDAIADGVDIITISIGPSSPSNFQDDVIAIGAFHAMKKGILTVNSAGNSGPDAGSVSSVAPWMLSVAASSIDRQLVDKVVLGNGRTLIGFSVNSFTLNSTTLPLIHGKDVSTQCSSSDAGLCSPGCLDSGLVKGKIVLCDQFKGEYQAHIAGAIGSVLNNSRFGNVSFVSPFPASALSPEDYEAVLSYTKSTRNPQANILKSEAVKDLFAPKVALFSSRGPNTVVPDIMKPDISAPGVDILAAYSPLASPSNDPDDKRRVKYNIMSGTSMACPHVAGVSAYIKTFHPDWSPSAIKSSIMTTAWTMNHTSDGEFGYGSGHVNPVKAANPGLVYEIFEKDYINMLCSMGYDESALRLISGDDNITCSAEASPKGSPGDLNYPSMTAKVSPEKPFEIKFRRRVKNVGLANSTYKANIFQNSNEVGVKVTPNFLSFKSLNEEKAFQLSVVGRGLAVGSVVSVSFVWSDGDHNVRSPIVVYA